MIDATKLQAVLAAIIAAGAATTPHDLSAQPWRDAQEKLDAGIVASADDQDRGGAV
jgi:hypothetical protein